MTRRKEVIFSNAKRVIQVIVIILICYFDVCVSSDYETHLINHLLKGYEKHSRPVASPNLPLSLNITLTLKQIIDLDERNQLLKTNLWLEYYWFDEKLHWNPEEYGNIRDIRIPLEKLWNPDILMYHSASEKFDSTYPVNIIVYDNGKCKYGPPAIFQSTCQIDMTWFPFDEQECRLKFGSWTYSNTSIDINISQGTEYSFAYTQRSPKTYGNQTFEEWYIFEYGYEKNGEWELLDLPAKRNVDTYTYSEHVEHYIDITYSIKIRRRTLYYFSNLIVPCVLIASISVLGFYFPPESGEKVSLEITILMSLTFFMQVVRDMQPPSSHIPLISSYFTFIMVMVASSVFATILVLNYHHRLASMGPMPFLVQKIFLQWLPWVLRMSRNREKITLSSIRVQNALNKLSKTDSNFKSLPSKVLDEEDEFILQVPRTTFLVEDERRHSRLSSAFEQCKLHGKPAMSICPDLDQSSSTSSPVYVNERYVPEPLVHSPFCSKSRTNEMEFCKEIESDDFDTNSIKWVVQTELKSILKEIRFITDKIRNEETASSIEEDWKFAAMVLDRACLIAFTLFTFILSAAVFMSPKHVLVY